MGLTSGKTWSYGVAVLMLVILQVPHLLASPAVSAPELDGTSVTTGLGVLAAGVLVMRAYRRSK